MNGKRIVVLFCVLAVMAVTTVGGWLAGSQIVSPAEVAARTAPPTPSPILVPVEERVLSSVIVTRGTARYGLPKSISIAPSALKANPGLITTLPVRNTQIKEGDVMLTASGRPVFVLQGEIPAYRDLVPRISGNDVRQLEQGLQRLGFHPGPVDGTYDDQTSAAVAKWYSSSGWEPFGPTSKQVADIRTLEQAFGEAAKNKLMAVAAAAATAIAVESARATADHNDRVAAAAVEAKIAAGTYDPERVKANLASATQAVEFARATAEHANSVAAAEFDTKVAERDRLKAVAKDGTSPVVESARAKADHSNKLAAAELAAKVADRDRLTATEENGVALAVEAARAKADLANQAAKADIAAKIWDRSLIVVDPRQTRTARAAADANLELTRAAALHTQLEGELAVQAAERDAKLAAEQFALADAAVKAAKLEGEVAVKAAVDAQKVSQGQLKLAEAKVELARAAAKATELEGQKAIQAALDAQKVAEHQAQMSDAPLELARAAVKATQLEGRKAVQDALDQKKGAELDAKLAEEKADRLAADLDIAKRKLGVQVPIDEIVFIPSLPVRVEQVTALVGNAMSGPVMSVTDNQLAIDSSLPLDAAPLVKPEMLVTIDEQALGINAEGVVKTVANTPGTHGVDGYHIYFEVTVGETTTPLEGFSLRLTIPIKSTKGVVTAVPLSALSLAPDGKSRVQVEDNGALEYVVVEPGLSADGFVEVMPVDGTLRPGQLVVVGYENY